MNEELGVVVVLCINLIVELSHIEVDEISNLLINSDVGSINVIIKSFEVWGLGCMSQDMIGDDFSHSLSKGNQPSFSHSSIHGCVVLPIHISSIEVVGQDEVSEGVATGNRVFTC